jgi:hypothetical protein
VRFIVCCNVLWVSLITPSQRFMTRNKYIISLFLITFLTKAQIGPWTKSAFHPGNLKVAESKPLLERFELNGTYLGKDLFIKNPLVSDNVNFCISKILVNGTQAMDNVKLPEFKLNLASLNLKMGDTMKIVIIHKDDCNQTQIQIDSGIQSTSCIVSINADKYGMVHWTTTNELSKLTFVIEQFRWNKWVKIGEIEGLGLPALNTYSFYAIPHHGENQIRIKQVNEFFLTQNVKWVSDMPEGKFEIQKKDKEIKFTPESIYEILDSSGRLIKKGFGKVVNIGNLPKGKYFLNYDNLTAEFKI